MAKKATLPPPPTQATYTNFQKAYSFFNRALFDGRLPDDVLIVLGRKANSMGHFAANRYSSRTGEGSVHELSLNPDYFTGHPDEEILSTLVHEMCHAWQHACGTPPKRHNHNAEWAEAMKAIGLQPSSTGGVGGNETGASMSHYIVDGGPFQQAYQKLAATGFVLDWQSAARTTGAKPAKSSKTKFACPDAHQNVWGAPTTNVHCGDCGQPMLSADGTTGEVAESHELVDA